MADTYEGENVELPEEDGPQVEDTEDGGAVIRLDNEKDEQAHLEHFANIVEEVDRAALEEAVSDLVEKIERDKKAREKRDQQYEDGLRRTGLGDDAPGGAQFSGANKVVHPMLVEACVDFSARVMKEIFPPVGPVRSQIVGKRDKDKVEKADRKTEFMNWQLTQQMVEFRSELEQLTTQLPLGGGQFMKFMWSDQYRRPVAEFIAIDDIYLPYAATNFYTAERKTHVQFITKMEYHRRVKNGMYVDVDLGMAEDPERTRSAAANDKIEGKQDLSYNEDGLRTIFEVYTHLDFGDGMEPYIISIDKITELPLALYRNWEPDDEMRKELDWIVEFPFVPWRGAYPIGLTHMIGGLSGAATGALRALLDSAHIQNVPTMLKLKGGSNGQTVNLQPTEVAELDGGALVDDIRKLAMPVPFNGPSGVLFQLLGFLVDAGKGVIQTSFEKLGDTSQQQPVGTTMALIEQGMVVFSSIHSRLHASMTRCLSILHRIDSAYLNEEDLRMQYANDEIDPGDFDGPLDVIPVSDPGIFSETQRFAQVQAIMQRSAMMPQMYDQRKVEAMFLRAMKVPEDEVLNAMPGKENMDPVSENVAASMSRPIYVLPKQDHMVHMQTHVAFLKSPLFGMNPMITRTCLYPIAIHLRDHLLNYYLTEAHEAVDKAQKHELISEEASEQLNLIIEVQQIIEKQFQPFLQEFTQLDAAAQKYKPEPPKPEDHSLQIAEINSKIQQQALQQQAQTDQAKLQLEQQKLQIKSQLDQMKAQQQAQQGLQTLEDKEKERQLRLQLEYIKQQQENLRTQATNASKEGMNTDDNVTAMRLAAAEIQSGEKVAFSSGKGINPNPNP